METLIQHVRELNSVRRILLHQLRPLSHNPHVTSPKTDPPADRPAERPARAESREVRELRELKNAQPDLATAADMQIELLGAQRRVQARVPLPSAAFDRRKPDHEQCRPALQFKDIPIDWSDFRLMIRQTADILRRFETLELADYDRIQGLARDGQIEAVVANWFEAAMAPARRTGPTRAAPSASCSIRCCCWRCARSWRAAPRRCCRDWS